MRRKAACYNSEMNKRHGQPVTVLGIPLDLGAENLGVDIGPDAFRYQRLIEKLTGAGFAVEDGGNITGRSRTELEEGDAQMRYLAEIVRVSEASAAKTAEAVGRGERVVALGGDHSINLGVTAGASVALTGDLGLIYLDAHGDMNTPETTLSGNIHGMHLASLLGHGPAELVNVHGDGAKIAKENLLHIGGSDFDPAELEFIRAEKLLAFTMLDLLSDGLRPLLGMIDALNKRVGNVWVSLDLDAIDSLYAPGAGMPNRGGLTYREVTAIATYVGQHCNVVGIDVVEYNPLQDVDGKTAELGIELIAKFLGGNYSWYTNYMAHNHLER
jgi:arginase